MGSFGEGTDRGDLRETERPARTANDPRRSRGQLTKQKKSYGKPKGTFYPSPEIVKSVSKGVGTPLAAIYKL